MALLSFEGCQFMRHYSFRHRSKILVPLVCILWLVDANYNYIYEVIDQAKYDIRNHGMGMSCRGQHGILLMTSSLLDELAYFLNFPSFL